MIYLEWDEGCDVIYATKLASGADVRAKETVEIPPGEVMLIDTGVRIKSVDLTQYPGGVIIPELQLRARSSLACEGIFLANGLGTIDCDYRDNIKVALYNANINGFTIQAGERIGQLALGLRPVLVDVRVLDNSRVGGFGSTGKGEVTTSEDKPTIITP
jgi:dUTP pyrophosphatase